MVTQKGSDEYWKEKAVLFVPKTADNRAAFFSPDTPAALARHDIRGLESRADPAGATNSLISES